MADFYQNGIFTTFHRLSDRSTEDFERELLEFSEKRPMTLVLPCLYSELSGAALPRILDHLREVSYLSEIVIGLDHASADEYRHAISFFSRLPQNHHILWNDGPRMQAVDERLRAERLAPSERGKGCNVWYCLGYVLARDTTESVALHDCDIVTYDRGLLARLFYPVTNPNFNYAFCKGFYARVADGTMHGRVSRLLITPLIRALKIVLGPLDYLDYLDSYRYPLAGEFSMRKHVLNDIRIPSDWGLEIGVVSEMNRNYSTNRICQVDIADNYDHKHQNLSKLDDSAGLSRMAIDIAKVIFRKLATNGIVMSSGTFRSIKATYFRIALDLVENYHNDGILNGLTLDIHREEMTVELFAENIMKAGKHFLENPMETPFIPSWNRIHSAMPDITERLLDAVEQDEREYSN